MLIRTSKGCAQSGASGRYRGYGDCGARRRCCSRRNCPLPAAAPRPRSPCSCARVSGAGRLGRAHPRGCTCRRVAPATGVSKTRAAVRRCSSLRRARCPAWGGCCAFAAGPGRPESGCPCTTSTAGLRVACGPRSPQGGRELLASRCLATSITQKITDRPVRGELRVGFRVYSAGDMGRVPTGLPTGAPRL